MAEPVSIDEVKAQVNMANDDSQDDFLSSLIAPARAYVERCTRLFFVAATRTEAFLRWGDYLEIYRYPVASIDEVTYGPDGTGTTYAGVQANLNSFPVRIYAAVDESFPTLSDGSTIRVTYTSGALDETSEEFLIGKRAMLLLIGFWFENRGEVPIDNVTHFALDAILDDIRPVSGY